MTKASKILKFFISVTLPFLAAAIGSYFTMPAVATWYQDITKPWFSPPNWLFGPVWTALFFLMGLALFFVWTNVKKDRERNVAVALFMMQLILNAFWSVFFFGLGNFLAAFVEIIILWVFIALTIIAFKRVSKRAAWLLLPYLLWVSFATILNFSIYLLN